MTDYSQKDGGILNLPCGSKFYWNRSGDGEVYGSLEDSDGTYCKDLTGWWRTKNPEEAATAALSRHNKE